MTTKPHLFLSLLALFSLPCRSEATSCKVTFDLNYPTTQPAPAPLWVEHGRVMTLAQKPRPEREGFRFAGWYTSAQCQDNEEWLFGAKQTAFFPPVISDSMAVEAPMCLYARWEKPKHITTPEQLDAMRENLHGWYVLDANIDLSGIPSWQPIGAYDHSYEYCDAEWWTGAFKGQLDGTGHTISGLHLSEGSNNIIGFFGALANGCIRDLILDNTRIVVNQPAAYAAPLIGIAKEGEGEQLVVSNCQITNTQLSAQLTSDEGLYCAMTGMVAGIWNGTISNCKANGKLDVKVTGDGKGDIYIGGIVGEGYSRTLTTQVRFDINTELPATSATNTYIGLLQASGTYINDCRAEGSVTVSGHYDPANGKAGSELQLYIGGIVGSERYDTVQHCQSRMALTLHELPQAQAGGIVGEFNKQFGAIGPMVGITNTCVLHCNSSLQTDTLRLGSTTIDPICGSGQPAPASSWFGPSMTYLIEGCDTEP